MARLLQIAQLGHAVLRQTAQAIDRIDDPELQDFIDDMLYSLLDSNGVGLAAAQVYRALPVIIVAAKPSPRYPQAPIMEPQVMINPRCTNHATTTVSDWEGCLSVPGIRGLVPRYTWVEIEYYQRDGRHVQTRLDDFVARIFQHELDHSQGRVFLDRVTDNKHLISETEYRKLMSA